MIRFQNVKILNKYDLPPHTGTFIKKKIFKKLNYSNKYSIASDTDFLIKLFNTKIKFNYLNKFICIMRSGGLSTSGRYFYKKFTAIFLLYFKKNLPQNLIDVMKNNRHFLRTIDEFIPSNEYDPEENNYGIQYHIYINLKKDIDLFPTNTDILIYLINQLDLSDLNYLEIGTSVFKNFQQIENSLTKSTLYAYDINDPVSVIKEKYQFNLFNATDPFDLGCCWSARCQKQ